MLAVRLQDKAQSPIRRRVRGTTKLPDDEARSADRAGTSATGVSKSDKATCTGWAKKVGPQTHDPNSVKS